MQKVTKPKHVPTGPHYAVLIYTTFDYMKDSRQDGGVEDRPTYEHRSREIVEHWVTTDKAECAKFVHERQLDGEQLVFFEVTKLATLKVAVTTDID